MALTPEGKVKAGIKKQLLEWGLINAGIKQVPLGVKGWFYMPQNNGLGVSGIPDFVGCIGPMARFFSIEAKASGKKSGVTAQQADRHKEIEAARGLILVADCVEDIKVLEQFI